MNIGYIRKEVNPFRLIDKIKYFFGIVTIIKIEEGNVIKLPISSKEKKVNKTIQKLLKKIEKLKLDTIVFSNDIIQSKYYLKIEEELINKGISILNGRNLMGYMDFEILEYILKLQKTSVKEQDIYFLIKKDKNLDLQFLSRFIESCKMVNIVTNDLDRFKIIQENIYAKEGILIGISNNKNKSLKRAKYIMNVNLETKDILKYKINRDANIINLKHHITYNINTFCGICVNYVEINFPDEYIERFEKIDEFNEFDKVKLYESILMKKIGEKGKSNRLENGNNIKLIGDIIKKDGIKLVGLIGNNGRISESEIIRNTQKVI